MSLPDRMPAQSGLANASPASLGSAAAGPVQDGPAATASPVTVVVSRRIKPGCEQAFEDWIGKVGAVALTFPGHLGIDVIRPTNPARPEFVLIFRFDRYENLRRWVESDERRQWLERAEPLAAGPMQVQELTGMEGWLSLPGTPLLAPPRYKTAIATWLGVFPISMVLNLWVVPSIVSVPLVARTLLISTSLVLLMTYAVMPALTRALRPWLLDRN